MLEEEAQTSEDLLMFLNVSLVSVSQNTCNCCIVMIQYGQTHLSSAFSYSNSHDNEVDIQLLHPQGDKKASQGVEPTYTQMNYVSL